MGSSTLERSSRNKKKGAYRVVLYYFIIGFTWITLSDYISSLILQTPYDFTWVQTLKGNTFILITAILLYFLIKRYIIHEDQLIDSVTTGEERYRLLVELSTDAIFIRSEGKFVFVNEAGLELFGAGSLEEIKDMNITDIIHKDSRAKVYNEFVKLKTLDGPPERSEEVFIKTDGTPVDVEVKRIPFEYKGKYAVQVIARDITLRKEYEKQLTDTTNKLRSLTNYLQTAIEEERTRISREIHDELGQLMTALKMELALLSKKMGQMKDVTEVPKLLEEIRKMSGLTDLNIQTIRKIATELRPDFLDNLGLTAAMQWQTEDFQRRTGIKCHLDITEEEINIEEDKLTAMFRVFQETMTNVARHSSADKVKITLKEDENNLVLNVEDNGVGIEEQNLPNYNTLGLTGMRERMFKFGGDLLIEKPEEGGTMITAIMPVNNSHNKQTQ